MTLEQGAWIVVGAVITGLFTVVVALLKGRADSKGTEAQISDDNWNRAKDMLDRLDARVAKLEAENKRISAENADLHAENQDQQELIREVAEYILQTDVWIAKGSPPPPPTKPQKIAQHVEQIRRKYDH